MQDKKELLKQLMIALANDDTQKSDKLLQVFTDYIPEISVEEVTEVAQKLDDEKIFSNAEQHQKIEQKIFQIIEQKIPQNDLSGFAKGHPIHSFLKENEIIRNFSKRALKLAETENSFKDLYSDWLLIAKQFMSIDIHYLRKENQLFPFLEKRGFSHPSTIMWTLHDEIRSMAKAFLKAIHEKDAFTAKLLLPPLAREATEMCTKEERVLYPTSARLLTQQDWKEIREGEDEIGWLIPEPPKVWDVKISMDKHLSSDPKRIAAILNIIHAFFEGKDLAALQKDFDTEL